MSSWLCLDCKVALTSSTIDLYVIYSRDLRDAIVLAKGPLRVTFRTYYVFGFGVD